MKLSGTYILLFTSILLLFSCSSEDTTTIPDNDIIEMNDDPEQGEIDEFKVMSYNISGNAFSTHKDSLIAIIKRNTIDILWAQELTGSIKSEFMSLLGSNFSLIETFPNNPNVSTHNIVYNHQTFSVIDFGYFETEFCGVRRFINWALLEKLDDNTQYYMYNNHLCHSDLELRKQHLVDLIDLMETHQIQTGINYKAIITGDFNSNTTTEYIAYI
jgi:exonuclease III